MRYSLTGDDTLGLLALDKDVPMKPPSGFEGGDATAARLSWRTLPNGALVTKPAIFEEVERFGMGPDPMQCVLMMDRTTLCPVRDGAKSR
jgi:hypothetical protein